MKKYLFLITSLFCNSFLFAQEPYVVADLNFEFKSGSTATYYYGFDEGDEVIIWFEESKSKSLKYFEFVKYPSEVIYSTVNVKAIKDMKIKIDDKSVYFLRFYNSSLSKRRCHLIVKRIPSVNSSTSFSTNVYWKTVKDTSYKEFTEKILIKQDTTYLKVVDKSVQISSRTSRTGNNSIEFFQVLLPENTIYWTYYIGADQESKEYFEKSVSSLLTTTSKYVSTINPTSALFTEIACKGLGNIDEYTSKRNVHYCFTGDYNSIMNYVNGKSATCFLNGNVSFDNSTIYLNQPRNFFVGLYNDNTFFAIDVFVKIYAAVERREYDYKTTVKPQINAYKVPYLEN